MSIDARSVPPFDTRASSEIGKKDRRNVEKNIENPEKTLKQTLKKN
jgi:hypothetical protein